MAIGHCAKQIVKCMIFTKDGEIYAGENFCHKAQVTCPREPGENYKKCKSICDQAGHAEEVALSYAKGDKADLVDAVAVVVGHTRICKHCEHLLRQAKIDRIILV